MSVRNVRPMIPTTRMTADSRTGNWSIHGLGPYWYELSTVGVGGSEIPGKWVSLSLITTAPARLENVHASGRGGGRCARGGVTYLHCGG